MAALESGQDADALSKTRDQLELLEHKFQRMESLEDSRNASRSILRSCEEIRQFDPTLTDGYHQIDPDGAFAGDEPITVYCELRTGTTFIGHDTLGSVEVDQCSGIACHQRPITYQSSMRQMIALIRQSRQCRQIFEWQVQRAPEIDEILNFFQIFKISIIIIFYLNFLNFFLIVKSNFKKII